MEIRYCVWSRLWNTFMFCCYDSLFIKLPTLSKCNCTEHVWSRITWPITLSFFAQIYKLKNSGQKEDSVYWTLAGSGIGDRGTWKIYVIKQQNGTEERKQWKSSWGKTNLKVSNISVSKGISDPLLKYCWQRVHRSQNIHLCVELSTWVEKKTPNLFERKPKMHWEP